MILFELVLLYYGYGITHRKKKTKKTTVAILIM